MQRLLAILRRPSVLEALVGLRRDSLDLASDDWSDSDRSRFAAEAARFAA